MSSPLHEQPAEGLAALCVQLDQIDERLLDTLRVRVQCCIHIAELKRQWSIPMMQPHRIGIVHERAATYASIHGMSPDFLSRFMTW
jgi:chorismate mutase-like protein